MQAVMFLILLFGGRARTAASWSTETFTLSDLVRYRDPECDLKSYNESNIGNLAIARTGSESLTRALARNNLYAHHKHDCDIVSLVAKGARTVMVSLRDPVTRLVSGVQRRASKDRMNKKKAANKQFKSLFIETNRVSDHFFAALRDSSHPLHPQALGVTFGPRRQSYMMPLVEFYLDLSRLEPGSDLQKKVFKTKLWFLCTESLTDDFNRAAKILGLSRPMKKKASRHHTSPVRSDQEKELLSLQNREWITSLYARDAQLHHLFCGQNGNSTLRRKAIKLGKLMESIGDFPHRVRRELRRHEHRSASTEEEHPPQRLHSRALKNVTFVDGEKMRVLLT